MAEVRYWVPIWPWSLTSRTSSCPATTAASIAASKYALGARARFAQIIARDPAPTLQAADQAPGDTLHARGVEPFGHEHGTLGLGVGASAVPGGVGGCDRINHALTGRTGTLGHVGGQRPVGVVDVGTAVEDGQRGGDLQPGKHRVPVQSEPVPTQPREAVDVNLGPRSGAHRQHLVGADPGALRPPRRLPPPRARLLGWGVRGVGIVGGQPQEPHSA